MVRGRLVVASDVGGHRELIRDRETGFLFAAGDAAALVGTLEELLAQRSTWQDMRQRARRFVEQERSWVGSVARYASVYERALVRYRPAQAAHA